eukprot:sb/3464244/
MYKELETTKCSLEDSVLSLKDRLSETPIYENVIYESLDEEDGLKDRIIGELRKERDHHRKGKGELERELRKIQELLHDLIRQLHQLQPGGSLKPIGDDFLIDSLRDAIEVVLHTSRDRQFSTTSSIQTSSGVVSDITDNHKPRALCRNLSIIFSDLVMVNLTNGDSHLLNKTYKTSEDSNLIDYQKARFRTLEEDLASLQRENALLHTDLLESRELIAALRKEMKELLAKLNSANSEDQHVREMLSQINDLVSSSVLGGHHGYNSNENTPEKGQSELSSEHRLTEQRLKMRDARLAEVETKLKQTVQELSTTECRLTATQSKLAVAEHRLQGYEQREKINNNRSPNHVDRHNSSNSSSLMSKKVDSLQTQLENTEQLLKEKMRLIRDKNEVIDSLLDEKRNKSRGAEDQDSSFQSSPGSYSPGGTTLLNLTPTTLQVSDYILLCPSNWLDELPELMRALRDALHSSLVDCKSVQVGSKVLEL